jgi:hypothetical protein
MREVHPKSKQPINKRRALVFTAVILLAIALLGILAGIIISKKDATNFKDCANAGGTVMESYPERCTINGKTFTNESQSVETTGEAYVGLSEEAALNKAADAGRAARVVKRDNQELPITMDFSPGRLNLYVQDNRVYMVQVEGQG